MSVDYILVVGGAGYIGSHMVSYLQEHDVNVVVLDDLSSGHRDALSNSVVFYQGDLADTQLLSTVFSTYNISTVMHFAACIEVGESVVDPAKYYQNNVVKTLALLDCMRQHNVNRFIFSSTAAVYGNPQYIPIDEDHPKVPINPYGISKWMVEQCLESYSKAYGLQYVALRYFNAAGAHPNGHLAERHEPETHIIPLLLKVANAKRDKFSIFGNDYPTEDGTCVRDFIHVVDLCSAHLAALHYLIKGGVSDAFNVGTGSGISVKTILDKTQEITAINIQTDIQKRRSGDPAVLVATADKLKKLCGWQPAFSDIDIIIGHAWVAEQAFSDVEALPKN